MSYSYNCYNNISVNYSTCTLNQEKESYGNQVYYYYPQEVQQQQPYMSFDNTYSNADIMYPGGESTFPLFKFDRSLNEANVLNDDNFSIVTASELYYSNTSPSLLSAAQLTPYSTPSPQISELYNGDTSCCDGSYNYYSQADLFTPVEENTRITKRKTFPVTEKRHICPICSHR
jgi:hypothetical protein